MNCIRIVLEYWWLIVIVIGIVTSCAKKMWGKLLKERASLDSYKADLDWRERDLEQKRSDLDWRERNLAEERSGLNAIRLESNQNCPWLSNLYADYYDAFYGSLEKRLRTKRSPAVKAADEVSAIRRDMKQIVSQNKMLEYQLHFYELLFPWLEEFKELTPQDAYLSQTVVFDGSDSESEYNSVKSWLSPAEYQNLSSCDKFQMALDRYQRRAKTNWEIGIEYERYIGYLCEQGNYRVQYTGAKLGLEDMGRDLIISSEDKTIVVQCKRWAHNKTIHEKHIFQLFGTCVLLELQSPGIQIIGAFVTTAHLSETAKSCALRLGIKIYEDVPMQPYPVIKCNISRTGEMIYHLPFDQQYDRVVIDSARGEFFASTVLEAENASFRRAKKHVSANAIY